jgi:hypothetical protein
LLRAFIILSDNALPEQSGTVTIGSARS